MNATPSRRLDHSSDPSAEGRALTADMTPEAIVSNETLGKIGFDVCSPALEMITDAEGRIRLLRMFCEEHDSSAARARESVVSGDYTVARDVLHKLMGTSATVGLIDLHQTVITLQDEIHTAPDEIDPATLDAFTDELDRVVAALDPLCVDTPA